MKARWSIVFVFCGACLAALLLVAGALIAAEAAEEKKEFKATCPVSGQPAIEDSVLDLAKLKAGEGKVYFCCKNCPKAFERDPAKFEMKTRRQLAETGQIVQVACPVSGHDFDKDVAVEMGNTKVAFCCENCLKKYNDASDDDKFKVVFGDLDKGFTWQVKCPVSGKPINPEHKVEYEGKQVYFCCPNCPAAFNADPKKFLDKLPQFAKKEDAAKK